ASPRKRRYNVSRLKTIGACCCQIRRIRPAVEPTRRLMSHQLARAADWIRSCTRLLIFTGAGISAESGIPTFRDDGGFWQQFPPEHFATWRGLLNTAAFRPRQFAEFLHAVIAPIASSRPNAAHLAIAAAENSLDIQIVTQNIDGLHQDAGSMCVYEI